MKVRKSRFIILVRILLAILFLFIAGCTVVPDDGTGDGTAEPQLPQPKTITDLREIELNAIIQKAAIGREDVMAFILFRVTVDHVTFSPDGSLALVWTALVDPQTGLVQSGEPGLVIAHKTTDPSNPWWITFQADPTFAAELQAIPAEMLSADVKDHYMPAIQQQPKDPVVYTGYRLPWTNGSAVYLTGSIGHVYTYKSCPSSCLYAFDFANGTMFPVRASRRGTVKYVVWQYPNGNTTNANYIVLEDTSTVPTTYQVYMHFAQNSIPAALRVVGTPVIQGQFLGNADDTGYSSGNHLHFHVHTNPTSYWGNSVDILFDEVAINGGRPRLCSEAKNFPQFGTECIQGEKYISQNNDSEPPTGAITNPVAYATITAPTLNVSGWMKDDVKVDQGQLYYNTGGDWTPIGIPIKVSPFTQEIDLCQARVPDGKLFLSIKVMDAAGRLSEGTQGLTELQKEYTCPPLPPACTPAENQAALYTEKEFQGVCQLIDIGEYPNLGSLTPPFLDNVASIQVGAGVSAIVFPDPDFSGQLELFQDGDSNLSDNTIGINNAASLKVVTRLTPPVPPALTLPEVITETMNLSLQWSTNPDEQTRSELTGPNGFSQTMDWQSGNTWQVGPLAPGVHQWSVEALNLAGTAKTTQEFTVETAIFPPVSHLEDLPLTVNSSVVLLKWAVDSGADAIDHFNLQLRTPGGEWVDWPDALGKDKREVLVWGEPGSTVEFRLRAVDLIGSAEEYNTIPETVTTFSQACGEDAFEGTPPGDDEFATAAPLATGDVQLHNWCPAGDADWVAFSAKAGDQIKFTTKPIDLGSAASLQLYKADGSTFLGEARPQNADAGAALEWIVPEAGVYTVRLSPVDARITGTDTKYQLGIEVKSTVETVPLICGSAAIPALLGGAYALTKKVQKKKPKGVGR
jgi:murein DD-endopeptidase MepM/ murein hydrolase activator NlpD